MDLLKEKKCADHRIPRPNTIGQDGKELRTWAESWSGRWVVAGMDLLASLRDCTVHEVHMANTCFCGAEPHAWRVEVLVSL